MTNNSNQKTINVNNVALPIATIISLLSFAVWGTQEFLKIHETLKHDIQREVSVEIKAQREMIEHIKGVIITIKERQQYQLENVWSKKDHMLWCYETQKKNSNFICPDYNSWRDNGLLDKYDRKYEMQPMDSRGFHTWPRPNQLTEDVKNLKK